MLDYYNNRNLPQVSLIHLNHGFAHRVCLFVLINAKVQKSS